MNSNFRFDRFDAEHVVNDLLGTNSVCSYHDYSFTKAHGHNDNLMEISGWSADGEGDLNQYEEYFGHFWAEKETGLQSAVECDDDTYQWSPNTDQVLQHSALDRSVELANSVPHYDTPDQLSTVAVDGSNLAHTPLHPSTSAQGMVAQFNASVTPTAPLSPLHTTADTAHVLANTNQAVDDGSAASQEGTEAVVEQVLMIVEATDDGTDEAADTPLLVAGGDAALPPNPHLGGFDTEELFEAYWNAKATAGRRRRCTLSDAFQLLFPEHAAANLIPVPKHRELLELIAILAFKLQVKYGKSGRRPGNGARADPRMWVKLHDALQHNKKPRWQRDEDAEYYYYYRLN